MEDARPRPYGTLYNGTRRAYYIGAREKGQKYSDHPTGDNLKMGKKLSPYQRIMQNAKKGKGVVLSADEVFALSMDNAIATVADNEDAGDEVINTYLHRQSEAT